MRDIKQQAIKREEIQAIKREEIPEQTNVGVPCIIKADRGQGSTM